jgi:hypothetical protein
MKKFFLLFAFCMLFVSSAQARGFVLFNTGDELFEVADFPAEVMRQNTDLQEYQAGYKCSRFGLFWADVWTWDCKLVAVSKDDSYADLPAAVVSQLSTDPRYGFGKTKRNFWNHYGFWGMIAAFVLMTYFGSRS